MGGGRWQKRCADTRQVRRMSSFSNPHYMYLFDLKNGKKKLAYGASPENALEILAMRLSQAEMDEILADQYKRISQRDIQKYVPELG
jgi:hypothetical protein